MTDTEILDWLSLRIVNVREHLRYGSRDMFWAYSTQDEADDPYDPSDLREQVIKTVKGGAN